MAIPKKRLIEQALNAYHQAKPYSPKKIAYWKKLSNERQLTKLAKELKADITKNEDQTKEIVTAFILAIDDQQLLFECPFLRFFLEQGYLDVAELFLSQAEKSDGQLKTWEVYQAMRNVWIMNSLQLYWDLPLELTPSIYAYSLLYPYTDNYLDDPDIPLKEKLTFNEKLSRVIEGKDLEDLEKNRVFELIRNIEGQFSREAFPDVFESIQFIHEAQIASLQQQGILSNEEVLRVSFAKGGSSVLADAFLVKGHLSEEEMQFAFNYGTFLQLLDDLQDSEEDKKGRSAHSI